MPKLIGNMNSELQRPTLIPMQPSQRCKTTHPSFSLTISVNPEAPFFQQNPMKRPTQVMMRPSVMMPNPNVNFSDNPMPLQRPNRTANMRIFFAKLSFSQHSSESCTISEK